jgi:hypothetical protein
MDTSQRQWDAFQTWRHERLLPTTELADEPLVVPRFSRRTGYDKLVVGSIGSGQSWSTKLEFIDGLRPSEPEH